MSYIKLSDSSYPHTERSIRSANPQTSYPAAFKADGYAWVFPAPQPVHDPITQSVREIAPALSALNKYEQRWKIVALDVKTIAVNQSQTTEKLIQSIREATQIRLDAFAKTRNYDGILSACSYATSTVPKFQSEGQCCVAARDQTWAALYTIMGEVESKTRPVPSSFADIESALPVLTW